MKKISLLMLSVLLLVFDVSCASTKAKSSENGYGVPDGDITHLVKEGDESALEAELELEKNPNQKDSNGTPMIILAIQNGFSQIAKLLITYEADINATDKNGYTALDYAENMGNNKLIDVVKEGLFLQAIREENVREVAKYIDEGVNYNIRDTKGRNGLHYVGKNANQEIAQALLDRGVNVDSRDNEGRTPLMIAAENGSVPFVAFLIENHANTTLKDNKKKKAIDYAKKNGYKEVVELLSSNNDD